MAPTRARTTSALVPETPDSYPTIDSGMVQLCFRSPVWRVLVTKETCEPFNHPLLQSIDETRDKHRIGPPPLALPKALHQARFVRSGHRDIAGLYGGCSAVERKCRAGSFAQHSDDTTRTQGVESETSRRSGREGGGNGRRIRVAIRRTAPRAVPKVPASARRRSGGGFGAGRAKNSSPTWPGCTASEAPPALSPSRRNIPRPAFSAATRSDYPASSDPPTQ
jgi:hypothetical protein